ncbi:MAG: hypothetical protein JSW40_07025 [Candidatus Omnitrophota bacterium]|nr:MAG: hypothetical protein JSW40_07025 [Candidatus Omnitrophota bacterium]
MKNTAIKNETVEKLKGVINAENTLSSCCERLSHLIKNGRIKDQFRMLSATAQLNEKLLIGRLSHLGVDTFMVGEKCKSCRVNPDSFSLLGAINLGIEITGIAIKFYRDLYAMSTQEEKKLFTKLLKEKIQQRDALKKERRFDHKNKENFIDQYCFSQIIPRLSEKL